MTLTEIDKFCLALPGATVRYPFDSNPEVRAWCLGRRMFAWCVQTGIPVEVQIKADPDLVPHLVANYHYIKPGYHMNKRHWITVRADACPGKMLMQLIEDSHGLVVMTLPQQDRLRLLGD